MDDDKQTCPECDGARGRECIKGPPNMDGGVTEWRECDLCHERGEIERVEEP